MTGIALVASAAFDMKGRERKFAAMSTKVSGASKAAVEMHDLDLKVSDIYDLITDRRFSTWGEVDWVCLNDFILLHGT